MDDGQPLLGFRFAGLESSDRGRASIDLIEHQIKRLLAA
jgi:hypothetical protein